MADPVTAIFISSALSGGFVCFVAMDSSAHREASGMLGRCSGDARGMLGGCSGDA